MRNILSFRTSIDKGSPDDVPGLAIAQYLEKELRIAGIAVGCPENYRDMAWSVDCTINNKSVFFFVGFLGSKVSDWQLIICSGIGLIGRLFGKSDERERAELAKAVHRILIRDDRFSDLKWYSKYTDSVKDVWYTEPN